MITFPEIDKKRTKKNVRQLLKMYSRLARLADRERLPKITTSYTFIFTQKTINELIKNDLGKEARYELEKIVVGLNKLSDFERRLLYDTYMNDQITTVALYLSYHMSESKFYRELEKALIHFAESYDQGKLLTKK